MFPGVSTSGRVLFEGIDTHLNVEDGTQVVYGYIGFSCLEVGLLGRGGLSLPRVRWGGSRTLYHCTMLPKT